MTKRNSAACEKCGKTVTWAASRPDPRERNSVFGMICFQCMCEVDQAKAANQ